MPDPSPGPQDEVKDVATTEVAPESSADTQVQDAEKAAEPSTADEGVKQDQPKSMLDAVKAAIEPPAADAKAEGDGSSPDPDGGAKEADPDTAKAEEEPPFHKHPRWQEMVKARKTAEARVEELTPEVETFRAFKASVAEAGLQAPEIDSGFEIMRLMKTDPAKAYEKLKPYMDTLEAFMGNRLPDDIQARLDDGKIDAAAAQELARARAREGFAQERSQADEAQRQRDAEANERQALQTHLNACAAKVSEWETTWKASDPDYARKQPHVDAQLVKLNVTEGVPKTVDEAVERVKKALKTVNDTFLPLARKTTEKRAVTTGGSSAGNAAPAPKSLREAVGQAAQGKYKSAA